MKVKKNYFLALFIFLLALPLIFSAPASPTNLRFENNVLPNYDEGVFNVVWDDGGGEPVGEYRVYVFSNSAFLLIGPNTTNNKYEVNGPPEANYSFIIEAVNTSGFGTNSSMSPSITVDSTLPVIQIIDFENRQLKTQYDTLSMNIFVQDTGVGLSNSVCFVNINGENQIIPISNSWCNFTNIQLTGFSDGNQSINVYANDSVGNLALDNSKEVWMDSSGPLIAFDCAPDIVNIGDPVTCVCNATDSGSGLNRTEYSENPSTTDPGTFTRTCTAYDKLGNSNFATTDYFVTTGYTGEELEEEFWVYTYSVTEEELQQGYTQIIATRRRVLSHILGENHSVGVLEVNETHAKIEIASDAVEVFLTIGERHKIDLLGDRYYDLLIILNDIIGNSTNLTIQRIREPTSPDVLTLVGDNSSENENNSENISSEGEDSEKKGVKISKTKLLIFGGIFLFILILFFILYFAFKKKVSKQANIVSESTVETPGSTPGDSGVGEDSTQIYDSNQAQTI